MKKAHCRTVLRKRCSRTNKNVSSGLLAVATVCTLLLYTKNRMYFPPKKAKEKKKPLKENWISSEAASALPASRNSFRAAGKVNSLWNKSVLLSPALHRAWNTHTVAESTTEEDALVGADGLPPSIAYGVQKKQLLCIIFELINVCFVWWNQDETQNLEHISVSVVHSVLHDGRSTCGMMTGILKGVFVSWRIKKWNLVPDAVKSHSATYSLVGFIFLWRWRHKFTEAATEAQTRSAVVTLNGETCADAPMLVPKRTPTLRHWRVSRPMES